MSSVPWWSSCPKCSSLVSVSAEIVGKMVCCPGCKLSFTAPALGGTACLPMHPETEKGLQTSPGLRSEHRTQAHSHWSPVKEGIDLLIFSTLGTLLLYVVSICFAPAANGLPYLVLLVLANGLYLAGQAECVRLPPDCPGRELGWIGLFFAGISLVATYALLLPIATVAYTDGLEAAAASFKPWHALAFAGTGILGLVGLVSQILSLRQIALHLIQPGWPYVLLLVYGFLVPFLAACLALPFGPTTRSSKSSTVALEAATRSGVLVGFIMIGIGILAGVTVLADLRGKIAVVIQQDRFKRMER